MKENTKEIIKSLSEVFEGHPWYGESVMRKLENVPYIIGYKTCIPDSHSVAEIIGHLISWKTYALEKLRANKDFSIEIDTEDDWPQIKVQSPEEWEELKRKLVAVQSEIYACLSMKENDSYLEEKVPGKDYNFRHLLKGILQHDIYHIGQIGLIESQLNHTKTNSGVFRT